MHRKLFPAYIAALFLVVFSSAAFALEKVHLSPEAFKYATGNATIQHVGPEDQMRIDLKLSGLEPDGVYSVWLSEKEAGKQSPAAAKGISFKSDTKGNAEISAVLDKGAIEKSDQINIAYHPDGEAKNTEMAILLLSGDLPPDV